MIFSSQVIWQATNSPRYNNASLLRRRSGLGQSDALAAPIVRTGANAEGSSIQPGRIADAFGCHLYFADTFQLAYARRQSLQDSSMH